MGRIWAIARQTVAEGIRMKVALVFIVILLLLLVGLPFSLREEDSVSSAVQTFLSFSLGSLGFILSLLTIFLSRSLSDELVNRQILLLMCKPIPRWQFVVGKWLGIVTLNASLLSLSGLAVYATVWYMATLPPRDPADGARLKNEILVARHATPCIVPDFTAMADRKYNERLETGGYDAVVEFDTAREKERLRKDIERQWLTVEPLSSRTFEFENIRVERSAEKMLQIRYNAEVNLYPADEILRAEFLVGNPEKGTNLYVVPRRDIVSRYHTFSVPTDAVAADRTLTVVFNNRNPFEGEPQYPCILTLQSGDDVKVLFAVGSFGGNLFRNLLLVQCKLMFLAAFALLTVSVFSFPVACLVCMTFLAYLTMSGFVSDAIIFFDKDGAAGVFRDLTAVLYRVIFFVIPNFSAYDGTGTLVDGRNVSLMWVLTGIVRLVVVGTTMVGLAACLLFQRREVSEVSL